MVNHGGDEFLPNSGRVLLLLGLYPPPPVVDVSMVLLFIASWEASHHLRWSKQRDKGFPHVLVVKRVCR